MKLLSAILGAALLASCTGKPAKLILSPDQTQAASENPVSYIITDYKNKAGGENMPEWAERYFEGGTAGIETMDIYTDRYVFVSRNEGSNFNSLIQWTRGFNAELDFPRLAAARIETRFTKSAPFPDVEYGAYYEELIRTASDAVWTGAVKEDDFWILKNYFPSESEEPDQNQRKESWEFFILVTINKNLFAYQLNNVFQKTKPNPAPTKIQTAAVNRVKDRFFSGF